MSTSLHSSIKIKIKYPHQRGVALITAMLIVALATIISVAMTWQQQVDLRRAQNALESGQLRQYLFAIEGWAGKILEQDRRDSKVDHLGEDWAMQLPPMPVDGGMLAGRIEDAQARFNINNLITDGRINAEDQARFRRLLAILELSPTLVDAVIDWLDADAEPVSPNGAEDDIYLNRQPPYRAANRPIADVSELRLIAGFDAEAYHRLKPHVTALPSYASINLNTASAEIIMALSNSPDRTLAENFIATREKQYFISVDAALQQPVFARQGIPTEGMGVATQYFMVMSALQTGRLDHRYTSLLHRSNNGLITRLTRTQQHL
ncbi:MAG: type II secretion system minor pseudopilin GspK [Thiohalomonadaceae bacterium]